MKELKTKSISTWNCAAVIVLSRHYNGLLDFDLATVEVFAVEPGDGELSSSRFAVGHCGLTSEMT